MRLTTATVTAFLLVSGTTLRSTEIQTNSATATLSGINSSNGSVVTADEWAPYEHWINGYIFIEDGVLFFHADKPVRGNSMKDVVLLGVSKEATALLPIYIHAASVHKNFRLFGALLPNATKFPSHSGPLPNVQFITWKMHTPGDPDVSPPDQRIEFNGKQATLNGKPVTLEDSNHHDVEAESTIRIDHTRARFLGPRFQPVITHRSTRKSALSWMT